MTLQPCKTYHRDFYKKGDRVFFFDYYHYQSADKMKLATVTDDQSCFVELNIQVDGEENSGERWGLDGGRRVKLRDIFDIYEDAIDIVENSAEEVSAPLADRVRVKLYFDANNICLGGCCDDNWLPLYSGSEYVYSEFFKLVPGFNPVGKTVKELQEIQREANPYKIAAVAAGAALTARLEAEKADEIAALEATGLEARAAKVEKNTGSADIPYSANTYSRLTEAYEDGKVLASERVNFSETNPGYIVLRRWGLNEWAIHYYNVQQDSFEFGHYFRDYPKARKAYTARIESYHQ